MRRYLFKSVDDNADNISSCVNAALQWRQEAFESLETLQSRSFWMDLVKQTNHKPIHEAVHSAYPFQWLKKINTGAPLPPYTIIASSIGNITAIKRTYNSLLTVNEMSMHTGFYAASEGSYLAPAVPSVMIGAYPGMFMVHVYTVLGQLKLTGSHYAYNSDYAALYFDEIVKILSFAGSCGDKNELNVGEVFSL